MIISQPDCNSFEEGRCKFRCLFAFFLTLCTHGYGYIQNDWIYSFLMERKHQQTEHKEIRKRHQQNNQVTRAAYFSILFYREKNLETPISAVTKTWGKKKSTKSKRIQNKSRLVFFQNCNICLNLKLNINSYSVFHRSECDQISTETVTEQDPVGLLGTKALLCPPRLVLR